MRGLFSYDNPIFITLETIINMVILSAMWAIFCIPVFTAGASTTALYYSVQKWLKHERGYAWSCFWDSFKENFKQATLVNLIFIAVAVIVLTDYSIIQMFQEAGRTSGILKPFFVVLLVCLCTYAFWCFASMARFRNTWKHQMKNAALLMFGHFPVTLAVAVIGIGAVLLLYLAPYLIFLVPVVSVWGMNLFMERVFRKYMSDDDKQLEDELNMVYNKKDYKNK